MSTRVNRLAFVFLDVFLGGFLVGILLLTTLGRPAVTSSAVGGSGLPYLQLRFIWNDPNLLLVPMLEHCRIGGASDSCIPLFQRGVADLWQGSSPLWPEFDWQSGLIRDKSAHFRSMSISGFDPRGTLRLEDRAESLPQGLVWMSAPCPGTWRVRLLALGWIDPIPGLVASSMATPKLLPTWSGYDPEAAEHEEVDYRPHDPVDVAAEHGVWSPLPLETGVWEWKVELTGRDPEQFLHCTGL